MNGKTLRNRTISGVFWSGANQFGMFTSAIITSIILARLLEPEDFGLIAMVNIIIEFARIIVSFGFGQALIQKQGITEKDLSTVFWFNAGLGLITTFIVAFSASYVASFYNEPELQFITIVLSFNFLIYSLNVVQRIIFIKAIDFKSIAKVEIMATIVSGFSSVLLAYWGYGVWSLVFQTLTMAIISCVLLWYLSEWKPKMIFDWQSIRDIWGFSINLFGSQSLKYWTGNIDKVLIGKYLSGSALGLYRQAYVVVLNPINRIGQVIMQVLFPTFAKIQEDRNLVRNIFLKLNRITALVTFPLMVGMFVCSDTFVRSLLGPKWISIIPILKIFSCIGLVSSINELFKSIFLGLGYSNLLFKVGLFERFTLIGGVVIGLNWGIEGVALGLLAAALVNLPVVMYYGGGIINLSVVKQLTNLFPILFTALIMGALVWCVNLQLSQFNELKKIVILAIDVFAGVFSYGLLAYIFKLKAFYNFLELIAPYAKAFQK
ncbi:MAG: MOP flippase family protein [Chitinophagales bacterium]